MTRLKQAWLALCGKLEPERVEVEKRVEVEGPIYGEAQETEVYRAVDPKYSMRIRAYAYGGLPVSSSAVAEWHGRYFTTCEQAFRECPGAEVVSEKVWRIGTQLYKRPTLAGITVQPKPKRPKGKW